MEKITSQKMVSFKKTTTITVTEKEYCELRDKTIDNILLNTKKTYKKDKSLLDGIKNLCVHLKYAEFNEMSARLVRGMAGFIYWCKLVDMSSGVVLTTLIHDLGEFKRNKEEKWFSPRSSSYDKYI